MEAHFIANKDEIQADHFNSENHVHNVFREKRRSACGLCLKAPQSTQVSVVTNLKNCDA